MKHSRASLRARNWRAPVLIAGLLTATLACVILLGLRAPSVMATAPEQEPALPTPTFTPTPSGLLDISRAEELVCGGVYSGNTEAFVNNVSSYGCKPWWDESGKEAVYQLRLSASQPVSVTFLSSSPDLDLFLLRDASPDSCVAAGDNYLSYDAASGTYYLSVDGYQGAQGSYRFRVQCPLEVQATQTPTFTPSPTPTATQPGTPTPTSTAAPLTRVYLPLVLRSISGSWSIPVTFTLQDGQDGYAGTTDTTLNSLSPTTTYGTVQELEIAYAQMASGTQKAPVLRFDLGMLPAAARVEGATLRLYAARARQYDIRADVQGLSRSWDEDTADWLLAAADKPWALPGASAFGIDRGNWVSNQQRLVEGSRWYEFDVTPLVRQWAGNQASNNGFVMNALAGDSNKDYGWSFVSREGPANLRPQLVVTYTLPGP